MSFSYNNTTELQLQQFIKSYTETYNVAGLAVLVEILLKQQHSSAAETTGLNTIGRKCITESRQVES
jgi:hypothetical protein